MRTIILLLLPITIWAQSVTDFGLPLALDEVKHVVLTSQRVNTMRISSGKLITSTTTPGFSAYALNYLHGQIHENGYVFQGKQSDGTLLFTKAAIDFTYNGVAYHIDPSTMRMTRDAQGLWTIAIRAETSSYKLLVNRKWVTYTAAQLAAIGGITVDQLWNRDIDYYYGSARNPQTHITSVFVLVNRTAPNTFTAQTYVNMLPMTSGYGNLVTSYNKTGVSYVVRWKLYNDCTATNATSGGYEAGNFGLCELRQGAAYSEVNAQTFSWDSSREYVTIECQIEETPAQGKNFTTSGYWVVQGCDADDPCGRAWRLPRKPVQ
jgi:hypothetical protein